MFILTIREEIGKGGGSKFQEELKFRKNPTSFGREFHKWTNLVQNIVYMHVFDRRNLYDMHYSWKFYSNSAIKMKTLPILFLQNYSLV